jgi:hypothetical protein
VSKVISKPNLKMEFNHWIKASILEGSKFSETLKKDLNILKKLILLLTLNKIGKLLIEKTLSKDLVIGISTLIQLTKKDFVSLKIQILIVKKKNSIMVLS